MAKGLRRESGIEVTDKPRRVPSRFWLSQRAKGTMFSSNSMLSNLNRREFVAASIATVSFAGCAKQQRHSPASVSIVRAPRYDATLYDAVQRLIREHKVEARGK